MPATRHRLTRLLTPVRRGVLRRRRLLAALLAAVAVATGIRATAAPAPPRVAVQVAAHDLPSGTLVGTDDLVTVSFDPGSVPNGLVDDPVGRRVAAPVRQGEPLTDLRLLGPSLTAGRPDLTAVPVRLPDAGMAALLHVGDRIDLVAADPQGAAPAQVVAADVPVLALPAAGGPGGSAAGFEGTLTGRLVVLGAAPAEVATIADAAVRDFLTFTYSR